MKHLVFIPILLTAIACGGDAEPISEPTGVADYHLINETGATLRIDARGAQLGGDADIRAQVAPGESLHFYSFVEASGGHLFPSNAFESLRVSVEHDGEPTVVYEGLDDEPWESTFEGAVQVLRLRVGPELLPIGDTLPRPDRPEALERGTDVGAPLVSEHDGLVRR